MTFQTRYFGQNFKHFKSIDSTQTYLKELVSKNEAPIGTLILTDHQNMGKGTQGRSWFSLPEPQLMFSLLIQPKLSPQKLPIVNILSGVLLAESIEHFGAHATVKWPNDVYMDGKKVSGILSELSTQGGETKIILGVGINTHAKLEDFPDQLKSTSTAISIHAPSIDRFELLNLFLQKLEKAIYEWSSEELISYTQNGFEKLWVYKGRIIEVIQDTQRFRGVAKHINSVGALELETETEIKKIISGSVVPV